MSDQAAKLQRDRGWVTKEKLKDSQPSQEILQIVMEIKQHSQTRPLKMASHGSWFFEEASYMN